MPTKKEAVNYFLKNGVNHPESMKEEKDEMDKVFKHRHETLGEDNYYYHAEGYDPEASPEPAPAPAPSGF